MKFIKYLPTILLIATSSAFGHGNPGPHSHPHSGGSLGWIAAIALIGVLSLAIGYWVRRSDRQTGN